MKFCTGLNCPTFREVKKKKCDELIEKIKQADDPHLQIAELKQKLEDVNELIKTARQMLEDAKATAYTESVDAEMMNAFHHERLSKAWSMIYG